MRVIAATTGADDEAQIKAWAAERDHDIIAVTGDTGPWLTDPARLGEWDILVTATLDAVAPTIAALADFLEWVYAKGKSYVTLDLPEDRQGGILYAVAQKVVAHERGLVRQQPAP